MLRYMCVICLIDIIRFKFMSRKMMIIVNYECTFTIKQLMNTENVKELCRFVTHISETLMGCIFPVVSFAACIIIIIYYYYYYLY